MELGKAQSFASPEEALKHFGIKGMRWGVRKDREKEAEFARFGEAYSPDSGFNHGIRDLTLKQPKQLRVDHSAGFADVRSIRGIASANARQNHADLLAGVTELRKQYPSVANSKIEMVPMSHLPVAKSLIRSGSPAAVMAVKPGEIRITYNDKLKEFSPRQMRAWEKWVPGMAHEGYVAQHELGHVLAAAHGSVKPTSDIFAEKNVYRQLDLLFKHTAAEEQAHFDLFKKHGLQYPEIAKLSSYAATSPQEGLAELVGNYNTPALRSKMTPDMQRRTQAMIDDMGGKK